MLLCMAATPGDSTQAAVYVINKSWLKDEMKKVVNQINSNYVLTIFKSSTMFDECKIPGEYQLTAVSRLGKYFRSFKTFIYNFR